MRAGQHDRGPALPARQLLPSAQGTGAGRLRRHRAAAGGLHPEVDAAVEGGHLRLDRVRPGRLPPDPAGRHTGPRTGHVRAALCRQGVLRPRLDAHRGASDSADTAIVRVERLYPFPEDELAAELARFPASADVPWVHEEPANQRAWSFLAPRLHRLARRPVDRVSRPEAPAPAVGSARWHALEQQALVRAAFR
ncbi:hypothetical protein [Streptomyces sp. 2231.1]|uniref:hypothetical protein n=1 Tax=Streptomyces sp. 2231.1 TaxID=1855347 RepID=UPI00210CAFF0|nr:hypothetical protein [Streptomyces sp. 2231.1]